MADEKELNAVPKFVLHLDGIEIFLLVFIWCQLCLLLTNTSVILSTLSLSLSHIYNGFGNGPVALRYYGSLK